MSDANIARRGLVAGAGLALVLAVTAQAAPGKPRVAITTDKGVIVVELEAQRAPITVTNWLRYVDAGKYDNATFYRAARNKGDPTGGTIVASMPPGSHPYPPIAHENTTQTGLRHHNGTISLGRFSPGSATADFFICVGEQPYLDADPKAKGDNLGYAAFGQVISDMGVARRILGSPTNGHSPFPEQKGQWLSKPVKILSTKRL